MYVCVCVRAERFTYQSSQADRLVPHVVFLESDQFYFQNGNSSNNGNDGNNNVSNVSGNDGNNNVRNSYDGNNKVSNNNEQPVEQSQRN